MQSVLTAEQLDQYERDGYIIVEDAVTAEVISKMRERYAELLEESRSVTESNNKFDLEEGHCAASPKLSRIKEPHKVDSTVFYDEVLKESGTSKLPQVLRELLGENVAIQTSKLNVKAPGGSAVEWHQDWAFYPATNASLLAIGLMVDDVNTDNAPLQVIPGSHKGPVLSHLNDQGIFCGAISPNDPDFYADRAVSLTGRAGTATIHHVRLLHGSAPNTSPRSRIMCFYECAAADAWPLAGGASYIHRLSQAELWVDLQQRMVMGVPCSQPRVEVNPIRLCLPPAPVGGSIFKTQKSGGAVSAFGTERIS
eukprot:GSChrysophyteH1.ASY1.ANO1.909.1 assembled CDS